MKFCSLHLDTFRYIFLHISHYIYFLNNIPYIIKKIKIKWGQAVRTHLYSCLYINSFYTGIIIFNLFLKLSNIPTQTKQTNEGILKQCYRAQHRTIKSFHFRTNRQRVCTFTRTHPMLTLYIHSPPPPPLFLSRIIHSL